MGRLKYIDKEHGEKIDAMRGYNDQVQGFILADEVEPRQAKELISYLQKGLPKEKEKELVDYIGRQKIAGYVITYAPFMDKFFDLRYFDKFGLAFLFRHFGGADIPYHPDLPSEIKDKIFNKVHINFSAYIDKIFKENGHPYGVLLNNKETMKFLQENNEIHLVKGRGR